MSCQVTKRQHCLLHQGCVFYTLIAFLSPARYLGILVCFASWPQIHPVPWCDAPPLFPKCSSLPNQGSDTLLPLSQEKAQGLITHI